MLCSSCGKENAAGVSFCEFCGVDLRKAVPSGIAVPAGAAGAAAAPNATAAAAALTDAGRALINSLTLGERFMAAGAAVAIIGFFLPFLSSPDLGSLSDLIGSTAAAASSLMHASFSLFNLAKFLGAIYFILLAAIGSGVLFYFSRKASYGRRLLITGFQVMIGSLIGPLLLVSLIFVPFVQEVAGMGYWFSALGFCAIAAGGIIAIAEIGKASR